KRRRRHPHRGRRRRRRRRGGRGRRHGGRRPRPQDPHRRGAPRPGRWRGDRERVTWGRRARRGRTMRGALTIARSGSGGGAGTPADLKPFAAWGVYGTSAITAVTAQNTVGVTHVQEIDPIVVAAQIEAVASDIGVDAVKTGMLASAAIAEVVADAIAV